MRLPALLTADLHLTASPADAYRWELFPFIAGLQRDEGLRSLNILGDLTDAKDYHPSSLTNRIVEELTKLHALGIEEIRVLMGNHDYLRKDHAFFEFLRFVPGIKFITRIEDDVLESDDKDPTVLWLPHTKTPEADWSGLSTTHCDFVFMHQTVSGARSSNGMTMEGERVPSFKGPKVYSGDIHVPQRVGSVEYVGSPYHVHFGDAFKPRVILLDRRCRPVDLHFPSPSRVTIAAPSLAALRKVDLKRGDQVKLKMVLDEADKHDWSRIRRLALEHLAEIGVSVFGVTLEVKKSSIRTSALTKARARTDAEVVEDAVRMMDLGGDMLDMGLELL